MVNTLIPLFVPMPGGIEMVVIFLIAILLFGANKIPELARSTGEAMGEFKKGRQELEQELDELEEKDNIDNENDDEDSSPFEFEETEQTTETEQADASN